MPPPNSVRAVVAASVDGVTLQLTLPQSTSRPRINPQPGDILHDPKESDPRLLIIVRLTGAPEFADMVVISLQDEKLSFINEEAKRCSFWNRCRIVGHTSLTEQPIYGVDDAPPDWDQKPTGGVWEINVAPQPPAALQD